MKASESSPSRSEPAGATGLALVAWLGLCLVLGRSAVLTTLELAHHGNLELAWLRLAHAFWPVLVEGLCISLIRLLAEWIASRLEPRAGARLLRGLIPPGLAVIAFLFLWGRLDDDRSRRIGLETPLGIAVTASLGVGALTLAALFTLQSTRSLRARIAGPGRRVLLPLGLLAALAVSVHLGRRGLPATLEVRSVELELPGTTWELLVAHPDRVPFPGMICPSAQVRQGGEGRPSLILPPPARVRLAVPDSAGDLRLVAGAGIDHRVAEDAGPRYGSCSVRFRVSAAGACVFEQTLPIAAASAWVEVGGSAGLSVRAGSALELETSLLDAQGQELQPADPLDVGFGGLALEERAELPRTRASVERPNIVLVLIDTLRADRTSAYGYERATTPHLEALARRGTLFEEACATASWTWPSTASILTGLLPEEHGVLDANSSFLPQRLDTLAEALQRVGFTTAGYSGSPLIVPDKHFDQGFETFDASREGRLRRSDLVLPGALEWLGKASEWRFFLYLHLMEPHAPFVPLAKGRAQFAAEVPTRFDPRKIVDYSWELRRTGFSAAGEPRTEQVVSPEEQRWISDLYDGSVWSADFYLGELLRRLDELGLTEETIVAVTADHGEELFDHHHLSHGHSLFRELVRVPLVIAGPGIPRGLRVRSTVSGKELGPVLARLGGSAIDGLGEPIDIFAADGNASRDALFSTHQGWWNGVGGQALLGLRRGSTVLHFAPEGRPWGQGGSSGGELRLYDLATDPAERVDLSARDPERARALRDELLQLLKRLEERRVETGGMADEATLEMLRDLGYIGK